MSSFNFFDDLQYYDDLESDEGPLDIFTAASLGDVSYFLKLNDRERLPSVLSECNHSGWTPVMYACSRGHDVLVHHLLHHGASKKCKSRSGITPLMLAIGSGDFRTFEYIFDVDDMGSKDDKLWTPLFYAVYFNRPKCLRYLLQKGADANIIDLQNETPLMLAIRCGYETTLEILLEMREEINFLPDSTKTLLALAKSSDNPKIYKIMMDHYKHSHKENQTSFLYATPRSKLLLSSNVNRIQYSPSPSVKRRSLFNLRINKSYVYSPMKSAKSSSVSNSFSTSEMARGVKSVTSLKTDRQCDVETFLKSLGLEKYWPIFRDEEVDFETLLTLGDHNLRELGITKYGPRRKIHLAIQRTNKKQF